MAASPKTSVGVSSSSAAKIAVDIVRVKKLPQGDDEPLPCSAMVKLECLETSELTFCTDVQRGTNNPYYNFTSEKEIPSVAPESLTYVCQVVEHARKSVPTVILSAQFAIHIPSASALNTKTELALPLVAANPISDPMRFSQLVEESLALGSETCSLVVRFRVVGPKVVRPHIDPNADVVLDLLPVLQGSFRLVPRTSRMAWLTMVSDSSWCEKFSACCIETWKNIPSVASQFKRSQSISDGPVPKKPAGKQNSPRTNSAGTEKSAAGIKSMSDVVFQAWSCKKSHQLLSRIRLSAEKFTTGEESIAFHIEEEIGFKRQWRERSIIRMQQCRRCYESAATDKLRNMLDRLWMLMAAGIPPDGPMPNISFDVRHKLGQAQFSTQSCETLLACLCQRLVPWLTFQECESLVKDDADPRLLPSLVRGVTFPPPPQDGKLAAQVTFVDVVAGFVGRIVDTLTDTEFAAALEFFIPAVREAYLRLSGSIGAPATAPQRGGSAKKRSGSAKKKEKKQEDTSTQALPQETAGDGVPIKYLDKLGRRVDEPKFA